MNKLLTLILSGFLVFQLYSQTPLDTALNFTVKDVSGTDWELFNLLDEGKIVVVEFMSTT